jgi:hypothetical protein
MEDGRTLIGAERLRQQFTEGFRAEHDEEHETGELARAAYCYRLIGNGSLGKTQSADADQSSAGMPTAWPWAKQWWKPKTRIKNLVRAGALYQAEIDRLTRCVSEVAEEINALD